MVRLLLEYGADPSLPENDAPRGHAAWVAAFCKNGEMLSLLLDHGADPEASTESGGRALDHVRDEPDLYALLLERGADPGKAGAPWATPLAWARRGGFDEIAVLLRDRLG